MLELSRLRAGTWEGVIASAEQPDIELTYLERPLDGLEISAGTDGKWHLRQPLPASVIGDGLQTIVIRDRTAGTVLGRVSVMGGEPLDQDLRAEIDLLRAELDLLKRAFRRHCVETGATG